MNPAMIAIEMGETRVSRSSMDRLVAHGLGACVGLCLYDAAAKLAAMVHVVLPETLPLRAGFAPNQQFVAPPGKCADTAVRYVVSQIIEQGARADRLCAVIAGGSQIFAHASTHGGGPGQATLSRMEIGPRNVFAVRQALDAEGISLMAEDVGGSYGRHLTLCVGTGHVFVRRIGAEERLLAWLGKPANIPNSMPREEALSAAR